MEVKEVEITKTEKVYTLTESELNELKCKERKFADKCVREYIAFCYDNYGLVKNLGFTVDFINELADFVKGGNYIRNTYKLSLWDYIEKYK